VNRLVGIRPNPFNPATEIVLKIGVESMITLRVHDLRGRLVRTLSRETLSPGTHFVPWNGRDDSGRELPSGIYFARFTVGSDIQTAKTGLTIAHAGAPRLVNYQGILRDELGTYLQGVYDLTFTIYPDSLGGGMPTWQETQPEVQIDNGLFNVILGRYTSLPDWLWETDERWLGVSVDGSADVLPRMRLTAVPWALRAAVADSALVAGGGGGADSDWILNGNDMYAGVNGNVGIGTSTPSRLLELDGNNEQDGLRVSWGDAYSGLCGELTHAGSGGLILNSTTSGGTGSWADISFQTNNATKMFLNHVGNFGLGTVSPVRKLHIDGGNAENGLRVAWGSNYSNLYGEFVHKGSGGLVINSNAGGSWADMSFQTEGVTRMFLNHSGNLGIGTSAPDVKLHVVGTAKVEVLKVTGSDLAENFPVRHIAEPGSVMAIDHEQPGQLRLSESAYDRRVAGVISGAGDLAAGAILGNGPGAEDDLPVALSGRVWVKCDATAHAIQPGDLLTTSSTPGHAMKAADHDRAQGAILGKAMTGLEGSQGLVLVLVSLQ